MKEYGGFLPLEICGQELYREGQGYELQRFNAARYAIVMAFRDGGYQKLWVPVYTCESVYDALQKEGVAYESYNISSDFQPEISGIEDNECILLTNYFGILDSRFYQKMLLRYQNIIFDNTQCFFCEPVMKDNVYNVYSPRKFVGVADGAYLISKRLNTRKAFPRDCSYVRSGFMFKSTEKGTNEAYADYLRSEDALTESGILEMSDLTWRMLMNVDYPRIRKIRRDNFLRLHEGLGNCNELRLAQAEGCPMVYPLLTQKNGADLRRFLVAHKIYVPQWWKWVLSNEKANDFERELSSYLYPLPIDQRYTASDMDEICEIVKEGLK